jgi:uncharacterized protein (DUF58 family)
MQGLVLPGMTLTGAAADLDSPLALGAGETLRFRFGFTATRGSYQWKQIRLTVSDPFRLFEKNLDAAVEAELFVLPGWTRLRRIKFHPARTISIPGMNLSHQAGVGTDFWGVREYHSGDSIRWIDWRHTARQKNVIITKEFEREDAADFGLILDARNVTNLVDGNDLLFQHSVEAALALAEMIVKEGNRLSLLILGKKLVRVFPGSGKEHLIHIQDKLAASELSDIPQMADLRYLPAKLFPSRALVFLISPLCSRDAGTVARLHRNGYQLVILSPRLTQPPTDLSDDPARNLAARAVQLERSVLLWKIRRMGVDVIDWPVGESLSSALQNNAVVSGRNRRRR